MKNILKTISCVALAFVFMFGMSACGKKNTDNNNTTQDPQKTTPTVTVSVEERLYFAGDNLNSVSLSLDDSSVEGTVVWQNGTSKIQDGANLYTYIFTPNDTKNYNTVTGSLKVYGIAKIYKTETDKIYYSNLAKKYIEFERVGNILNYTSNFADAGTVIYENEKVYLKKTSGEKAYSIEVTDIIKVYDAVTGDYNSVINDLGKTYYPEFLGTYYSNTMNDASNLSSLELFIESGVMKYTLNFKHLTYGSRTQGGIFSVDNNVLEFTPGSGFTTFGTWSASYNPVNNSIYNISFLYLTGNTFTKG